MADDIIHKVGQERVVKYVAPDIEIIPIHSVVAIHNNTINRVLRFISDWEDEEGELPSTEVIVSYLKGLKI
ncbi:MAG: hypothetical protein IKE74_10900 [Mogibacterium sp.]|nr:hypothetical protein [Mogibacterium sp.]